MNTLFLTGVHVGWVYLWTSWTETTTRTHVRSKRKEKRSRVRSASAPHLLSARRRREDTKRGTCMSVYMTGLRALRILTHHWSICRMLQQSRCLSFFVPLSFQMTVDQPHQLQIWKRYVMTNTLKCLLFYTFLCATALFCTFNVHGSAASVI